MMEGSDYYDPDVVARDLRELDRKPVIMTGLSHMQPPLCFEDSFADRNVQSLSAWS